MHEYTAPVHSEEDGEGDKTNKQKRCHSFRAAPYTKLRLLDFKS